MSDIESHFPQNYINKEANPTARLLLPHISLTLNSSGTSFTFWQIFTQCSHKFHWLLIPLLLLCHLLNPSFDNNYWIPLDNECCSLCCGYFLPSDWSSLSFRKLESENHTLNWTISELLECRKLFLEQWTLCCSFYGIWRIL